MPVEYSCMRLLEQFYITYAKRIKLNLRTFAIREENAQGVDF